MQNLKKIFLLLTLLLSLSAHSECGFYEVMALVHLIDGQIHLVIYPKTKSEINLIASPTEFIKLSPYINRFIKGRVLITEEMDFTLGKIKKLDALTVILPNPLLTTNGTKFQLIESHQCEKSKMSEK